MKMPLHKPAAMTHDLKQRVIVCLNKLSDRDTLSIATAELESIARNLTQESFSSFINCIQDTDSSCKSPVRRQCVDLLTLLSHSYGDALSPFLSRMISIVICRLRDPDSVVRSACVEAISAMSCNISKPPFSVFLKPLMETMTIEQDFNSQIGAAMCLTAAIEAAPDLDSEQLRKVLPRLGKLAKNEGFKAKSALFTLIGSIVGAGGGSSQVVLEWLVPCIVEFLSSEDWAARKAAAEALGRVAVAEKDLAREHKTSCLASLENRRFDKVKVVRETMNHTLKLWKDVLEFSQEESKSSSLDNPNGECVSHFSKSSKGVDVKTPRPNKTVPISRSPPSDPSYKNSAKSEILLKNKHGKLGTPMVHRVDHENSLPHRSSLNVACEDDVNMSESSVSRLSKHVVCSKTRDGKKHTYTGTKSASRVLPVHDDMIPASDVDCSTAQDAYENYKEIEDLSLIHKKLMQIENQQSSLLNLLQNYIGSSQTGINSLETRVHGLEMALDEITHDLALSNGRIRNPESAENTCCKLPGADFLSTRFWRKTEGPYSTSLKLVNQNISASKHG